MNLQGTRVGILVAPQFHDQEATVPFEYLTNIGASVEYIGLEMGLLTGKLGRETIEVKRTFLEANPAEYDGIIIPGGGAPERLRIADKALEFVSNFWYSDKPVAAICHGPQVLISIGVLNNKKMTCYAGIRDDVILAGAMYEDAPVVVDGQLITSRKPEDLPQFNEAFAKALASVRDNMGEDQLDVLESLELAIAREKGARDFYEGISDKYSEPSIKNKFSYLATIEQGHFDELSDFYLKICGKSPKLEKHAAEIGRHVLTETMTVEGAMKIALDAEDRAYEFYRRAAGRAKSDAGRDMFLHLANEELEHKRLLSVDLAAQQGGRGHFQWATYWDVPPGMDDLW